MEFGKPLPVITKVKFQKNVCMALVTIGLNFGLETGHSQILYSFSDTAYDK